MKKINIDYTFLVVFFILLFGGILFLAGASAVPSQIKTGRPNYYLLKHLINISIGLFLGYIFYKIKLSSLKKWSFPLFIISLFSLLSVFLPVIGIKAGGAHRWINLYFFSIQPSELFKIFFIIYLSAWFFNKSLLKKKEKRSLLPFLFIIIGISLIFILQPDMSTLAVIIASALMIYFFSDTPLYSFFIAFFIILILFSVFIFFSDYRVERVLLYLGIISDPMGIGFQTKQSIITIGSGGAFGMGLGTFNEKFNFLPQTIGDSIFSVIASESGFLGSLSLIILFFFFFYRGIKIAEKSRDEFSYLLSVGISTWIFVQAVINITAMVGIIPITGIPMPFISYGGSHIISELIAVGIILNISKNT